MRQIRNAALGAAGLALAVTLTACSGGSEAADESKAPASSPAARNSERETGSRAVMAAMTAATKKTTEAKSARVSITMKMPGGMGGDMEMSGVMSWDPMALDMVMSGGPMAANGAEEVRYRMVDGVAYIGGDPSMTAAMEGKSWLKMDMAALAEQSGDAALAESLTGGVQNVQQTPAQQMALLLESPNVDHAGEETIDGERTQHYRGKLSVEEMMDSNAEFDSLQGEEREQLLANLEKSGVEGYDIGVWLNEDELPVRMDVTMSLPQGDVEVTQRLSDYGVAAEVTAPPAAETLDLVEMLEELGGPEGLEGL
ncbi:hypothetical protein V1J52_22525 [Streptomyces sp. TRM 70351]|uniref:hypothetical protein n=1 Tax=Streptomyces sp. TRM 70351 TaxID=3116552 RepID=UPI002E7BAA66|nr:hypothetical protein [Streptomyces sp. TRM 70351]MEE1930921.1 hypothetical protein [Streptomyces sp. TRM 70351]